jgi:hypothetical protein
MNRTPRLVDEPLAVTKNAVTCSRELNYLEVRSRQITTFGGKVLTSKGHRQRIALLRVLQDKKLRV